MVHQAHSQGKLPQAPKDATRTHPVLPSLVQTPDSVCPCPRWTPGFTSLSTVELAPVLLSGFIQRTNWTHSWTLLPSPSSAKRSVWSHRMESVQWRPHASSCGMGGTL